MSQQKVRLFVALSLPGPVRDALARWRSEAAQGLGGLRLIRGEDLHVTLCFLGWQTREEVEAISTACAAATSKTTRQQVDLAVGPAIWLPPRRPRVLAVELADRQQRLSSLQAGLAGALQAGGWYEPEQRPYRAHVTVARVARGARVRPSELTAPPQMRFTPQHVTLYRSHLSAAGARYEPIAQMTIG